MQDSEVRLITLPSTCIISDVVQFGQNKRYSYTIHYSEKDILKTESIEQGQFDNRYLGRHWVAKDKFEIPLLGKHGELPFIIFSQDIHELFLKELEDYEEVDIVGQSIDSEVIIYNLVSRQNMVKFDPSFFLFSRDQYIGYLDRFFILPKLENISQIINSDTARKIAAFLSANGIPNIQAILEENQGDGLKNEFTMSEFNLQGVSFEVPNPLAPDFEPKLINSDQFTKDFRLRITHSLTAQFLDYKDALLSELFWYSKSLILSAMIIEGVIDSMQFLELMKIIQQEGVSKGLNFSLVHIPEWVEYDLELMELYRKLGEDQELAKLVQRGESKQVEFKSTLRYDIRASRFVDERTLDVLRTMAGFLNTDGGRLFIGIEDDGSTLGIELDGFKNHDKFQLYLSQKIQNHLKSDEILNYDLEMYEFHGKTICIVTCVSMKKPVMVKWKNEELFFIRTGPSTTKLAPTEMIKYVTSHFTT